MSDLAFYDLEADPPCLHLLLGDVHEHRGITRIVVHLLQGVPGLLHVLGGLALPLISLEEVEDLLPGQEGVSLDDERLDCEGGRPFGAPGRCGRDQKVHEGEEEKGRPQLPESGQAEKVRFHRFRPPYNLASRPVYQDAARPRLLPAVSRSTAPGEGSDTAVRS